METKQINLLTACKLAYANSQRRALTRGRWTNKDQEAHEALATAIAGNINEESMQLKALKAVYQDIELQNVKGGSDELNVMVQQAIALAEPKGE